MATAPGLMDSVFLETMPTAEVTLLPPALSVAQMKAIVMVTVDGQKESVNPQPQVPRQSSRNFDTKISAKNFPKIQFCH